MLPWTYAVSGSRRLTYVDLNGSNEGLRNSTAQAIGIADSWSIMFILRPQSGFTAIEQIVQFQASGGGNNNLIGIALRGDVANDPLRMNLRDSGGTLFKSLDWNSFFTAGTGVHVLITKDGAAGGDPVVLYKNGSSVAASGGTDNTGTQTNGNRTSTVGIDQDGSSNPFNGEFAEVAVWSSVLTSAEAAHIYAARRTINLRDNEGAYVSGANLQHWWRPGYDPSDIGKDFGRASTLIDIDTNASNITFADDIFTGVLI